MQYFCKRLFLRAVVVASYSLIFCAAVSVAQEVKSTVTSASNVVVSEAKKVYKSAENEVQNLYNAAESLADAGEGASIVQTIAAGLSPQADMFDSLRLGYQVALPDELSVQQDLNDDIEDKNAELVATVGTLEGTALSNESNDVYFKQTVVDSANSSADFLASVLVDIALLDGVVGEGSDLSSSEMKAIEIMRMDFLRQAVNSSVLISEYVSADSREFVNRVNRFSEFSESAGTEVAVLGLMQDSSRYILYETLRSLMLTSSQMLLSGARLLTEREVRNEE